MKKVFLMAYARKNLGDDLFIKMLLERYSNDEFYMKINDIDLLSNFNKYDNFHIIKGDDTDIELFNTNVNDFDAYIYIGGSIFMEGGKVYNLSEDFFDFVKRCKQCSKPFCYISCIMGPYQTQEYFELSRKNFETCTDICFRDKYSYNLFKDIKTVRYAPDFAFTYPIKKDEKIPNSIGISVIDLDIRKDLKDKSKQYINMLVNNIKKYIENGKKIYLYSFCNHEGDEKTINTIMELVNDKEDLIDIRYNGDVDEFLDMYGKMEYMICARFHAMILSSVARQKMYIMSYSKKIDNVIDDLNFNLPILHFKDLEENLEIDLSNFVSVEEEKINEIIKEAELQEEQINKVL